MNEPWASEDLDAPIFTNAQLQNIAEQFAAQCRKLEHEKVQLATALVQAAGGRIEVSNYDLIDLPDIELHSEKRFDTDSTVYVTRRRRKTAPVTYVMPLDERQS